MAEMIEMESKELLGVSREVRTFTMWLNALGAEVKGDDEGWHITNLFESLSDGVIILRVLELVGSNQSDGGKTFVNWRKANRHPKNRYHRVENCNYCLELAKVLGFSLHNIGGLDILDKNSKIVQAFLWQLMNYHICRLLNLGGDKSVDIQNLEKWVDSFVFCA